MSEHKPLKFLQSNKESNKEACEQHLEQKKKYLFKIVSLKEDIKLSIKFQSSTRPLWKPPWKFKRQEKNLEIRPKHKNFRLIPNFLNTPKEFETSQKKSITM